MMIPILEPVARMRRQTSKPSISGSITSSRARQMSGLTFSFSSAIIPFSASMGSYPLRFRLMTTKLRMLDSSSRTRIFFIYMNPLSSKSHFFPHSKAMILNYIIAFTKLVAKVAKKNEIKMKNDRASTIYKKIHATRGKIILKNRKRRLDKAPSMRYDVEG